MEYIVIALCVVVIVLCVIIISMLSKKKDTDVEGKLSAITENVRTQDERMDRHLKDMEEKLERRMDSLDDKLFKKVESMASANEKKLEEMRQTVDEKLTQSLETRLTKSFSLVNERLEAVYKGLGEMQSLANGVGDLKKVLTNVKSRGIWGEIQLGSILDQMLTKAQYAENVQVIPGNADRVEFAIIIPSKEDGGKPVYIPIDSKYPVEDYQHLIDAQETGNKDHIEAAYSALEKAIKAQAKKIHDKYIEPPYTTNFAIMFLPTEGLFAEVLRRNALCEQIQRDYSITITGPTTLSAFLSSLQMGFRTLAIEKRSTEVWELLGAIKTEFGKFASILEKTQQRLRQASDEITSAATKTRTIERKLRGVQELSEEQAQAFDLFDSANYLTDGE